MRSTQNRRQFLSAASAGLVGLGVGYGFRGWLPQVPASDVSIPLLPANQASNTPQEISHAVSLRTLQRKLSHASLRVDGGLRSLGGLNRIFGFVRDSDEDVILFGRSDPGPSIDTDCLVVALRNAYSVSAEYQGAPGCTINPSPGDDPWTIQEVQVFGMPADCTMAARHVALDYELKKVGAALVKVPGVRSTFELLQASAVCEERQEQMRSVVHRYWF